MCACYHMSDRSRTALFRADYVPMACLGGIIEASLVSLFEWKPFKKSYRISKPDFAVMCVTAFTTAFVNIEVS